MRKGFRDHIARVAKLATWGVSRAEIGNLFETFKTNLLGETRAYLETFKTKKIYEKQNEEDVALSICCAKCRGKNSLRSCSLDIVQVFSLFLDKHDTTVAPFFHN